MIHESEERDLQERFLELREEVSASAPPFSVPAPGPQSGVEPRPEVPLVRHRPGWRPWILAAAGAAAIAATLIVRTPEREVARGSLDPAFRAGVWIAPTDFLLNTPTSRLPRSFTSIGLGLPGLERWSTTPGGNDTRG